MTAWISSIIPEDSDFTLENLPWGVFKNENTPGSICVRVGNHVMDVHAWALTFNDEHGFGEDFDLAVKEALQQVGGLDLAVLAAGASTYMCMYNGSAIADYHERIFGDGYKQFAEFSLELHVQEEVTMLLPIAIGDYTDFYCSKEHATHVGTMFRGKDNALNPNWLQMPIGYHGRASSIVVSGATVPRPWGQVKGEDGPLFRPSEKLDFELELACVLGSSSQIGSPITMHNASRHIFGYMLMNDCSARDIQQWEYVPLGPFNGKNFATVISPWIVQHEALAPFMCAAPEQVPEPLPYLHDSARMTFDLAMTVDIKPEECEESFTIASAKFRDLYWTFEQMLTHHTVTGCNIKAGDIIASGTVSSEGDWAQGCLLELTENGKSPIQLPAGCQRTWLQNGDSVIMSARADNGTIRVGFGPCNTNVSPAVMYRT